jgi:glyoxylase-like metal-dependent hydrolase (beta-lactamase superfamily II)
VLIDTGLGTQPVAMVGGIAGDLPGELTRKGVDADSIDTVFMTHMHFDHVGANMGDDGKPRFKNARYVAGKADWDFFKIPEVQANFPPGSFTGPVEPLQGAGVLDLVEGEHTLAPEVTAIPTPGHTPGHMSILISSGGEKAIITGDVLASPAHITHPDWAFMFDADQGMAVATRTALIDRAEAEGMKIVACHLPAPGFGTVVRMEGKRYWQGV